MDGYMDTIRRILDGDYDDATRDEREQAAREVLQVCAVAAGAVALQPFPLVDVALVTPIQIVMVQAIGRIYGHGLDRQGVFEFFGAIGAGIVSQQVIMAGAKLIPFIGWIVGISIAFALTWAIGEVCIHYFSNGRQVPIEELQEMFSKVYETKKAEKQNEIRQNDSLKDRLQQLKDAYKAGVITEEEFQSKKEELLSRL